MLYTKYLKMHVKTAMQFRLNSFILMLISTISSVASLLAIGILFSRFHIVANWGFYECALMYGITISTFAIAEMFGRGFDDFSSLIKHGELDRLLVRPRNIFLQIFGSRIEFSKIGRIILGIVVTIISLCNISINWTFTKVIIIIGMFICGILIFFGLLLLSASVVIFTVEHPEFLNIINDGTKEVSYYPINIYAKGFRIIFTYIIPVACFNYLPLSYILGFGGINPTLCALSPLIGCLFIIPCFIIFKICLKKYQSTGT